MKTITDIEKMGKIVRRLKWIDSEIIRLEKIAMKVVNGNAKINIYLRVITEKPEDKQEIEAEITSTYKSILDGMMWFTPRNIKPEDKQEVDILEVREEMAYRMFDMYLKGLVLDRQALIIQLEQFGVNI